MASAATLVSPRLAHGSMMDSSSLSPSPIGLDNLSFDDLVEWNTNSYFNNNSNSNSNSPRMSNATLNSNSTFTSSTQPHIPQADYSSTSAHMNNGNGSDSIPPSNSTPEDLFRHYLSLELRKIGSPVNDSLLDHYVKQHAQGLARVNGGGAIQPSHATSSSSSSRENSPPELDPTASNSSSTSSNAASPTFSRRAFSLSPLPEEAGEDQDRTAKAFKIHQENDGQFSHFGRSSLGMGMGMSLENSGFGNDINGGQQDSEMSSIDPSSLIIKKQSDAISEDEDETGNADETLVDSKNDLAAIIAKNLSEEDSKKQSQSSSTQDTQSSTTNIIPSVEKPPSAFDSFKPPRIGEPPLHPNYSHPSSVKPVLNRNKKNGGDDEDEIMITTNAVSYDDPDKPTPEEYKKMTSKEKRQLRNKISARNFRERRKDYIAQLEREMQERDYTIASLRAQLERVGLQNQDLKKEVKTLRCSASAAAVVPTPETVAPSKPAATSSGSAIGASISQADVQRILDALQKSTVATQTQPEVAASNEATPRTAPVLSTSTTTATSSRPATPTSLRPISPRPSSSSSPIPVPNTRKDAFLSSDGSNSTSSFWAGGRSNSLLGGSGFMSVHTTLLPTIPFNPTTNVVVKKGKVNGGLSEKKSNFGLTFKGLNNHLRTFKSEKIANNEKSFLPPPAYSDHSFFDFKKSEKMMKREPVGESFDVYDAFASLLNQDPTSKQPVQELNLEEVDEEDRGDEALPTYVESILTSSQPTSVTSSLSPSLSDEAVEDRVLEALYKAFSNDNSSTSSFYPLDSKNSMAQKQDVDLNKIAALLDGKAELVLVDSESRREWNGQEAARVDGGLGYNARAIMARH